jgi:hypothetical protein
MKKKFSIIYFLFLLSFFAFNTPSVLAISNAAIAKSTILEKTNSNNKTTSALDIFRKPTNQLSVKNLSITKGSTPEDENIEGNFVLEGQKENTDKFFYILSLTSHAEDTVSGNGALLAFSNPSEITILNEQINFSLAWPKNITAGTYNIRVDVYDANSAIVAFASWQLPRQKSGTYLPIENPFLSWNQKDKLKESNPFFGIEDHIYLGASISPLNDSAKNGQAKIIIWKDNRLGKSILDYQIDKLIFEKGEVRFNLKKENFSTGVYFVSLQLYNTNNEPISNILNYHFSIVADYTNNKSLEDATMAQKMIFRKVMHRLVQMQ